MKERIGKIVQGLKEIFWNPSIEEGNVVLSGDLLAATNLVDTWADELNDRKKNPLTNRMEESIKGKVKVEREPIVKEEHQRSDVGQEQRTEGYYRESR